MMETSSYTNRQLMYTSFQPCPTWWTQNIWYL